MSERCSSYADGNCTQGCCEFASWIPEDLGDGGDWAANAPSHGLQVTMIPTAGSVVSYCRGDGYSPYGHCAYVERVNPDGTYLVKERNYVAWGVDDERVSTTADVCGFILPPGGVPGQGAGNTGGGGGGNLGDTVTAWGDWQYFLGGGFTTYNDHLNEVRGWFDWLRNFQWQ